ncbi:MAG: putative udp-n-acetylmuramoylalanyl-d-glutamyl-2,6-diaminopimelate--d-alanyl-d-alanyl ligase protein [Deltaproteobacteria bacterium]|nr:putative udp-n-acetylmuramoylalanyl-d-glutamyl-2,6-diaminopimelate--d-alanyl-d-alanyl ligase protein [Deltaproteobacteria bacterium]
MSSDSRTIQAGRRVAAMNLVHLFVLGEAARSIAEGARKGGMEEKRIHLPRDLRELMEGLEEVLTPGDWILIKGSRRMRMERVVEGLKARSARS